MSLKQEFDRLFHPKELSIMVESHKFVTDAAFKISFEHGKLGYELERDHDAYLLFQMTLMKSLSVLKLTEGITHVNTIDGTTISDVLEPFSMSNLIRSQYEAFCNFNNIYVQSTNDDELNLKYNLWEISGLNYRQRFNVMDESKAKQENEKKDIEEIEKSINENPCFLALDEKSRQLMKDGIKSKDWQFRIEGTYSRKKAWHELMKFAGTNDMFDHLYSSLSLSTHPSNVSVFQFKNLHDKDSQLFLTKMALMISKVIMAMYIRDYCTYYPACQSTFNSFPEIHQALINCYNFGFRNPSYTLNTVGVDLLN